MSQIDFDVNWDGVMAFFLVCSALSATCFISLQFISVLCKRIIARFDLARELGVESVRELGLKLVLVFELG